MTIWNERYANDEFAYGTEPNRWLASQASRISPRGKVLSLGEGEGRNAVWLAQQGFSVDAVDGSSVGLTKARRLAHARNVTISTTTADLADYSPSVGAYDGVVLIFLHLPPAIRRRVHTQAQTALKPGGIVIIEAFTPRQLPHPSGGPKQIEMLYEPASLLEDLPDIVWQSFAEVETELSEGPFHQGKAAVVRGVGRLAARASKVE